MLSIYYGFSLEYVVMDYKEMKYNLSDIDFLTSRNIYTQENSNNNMRLLILVVTNKKSNSILLWIVKHSVHSIYFSDIYWAPASAEQNIKHIA